MDTPIVATPQLTWTPPPKVRSRTSAGSARRLGAITGAAVAVGTLLVLAALGAANAGSAARPDTLADLVAATLPSIGAGAFGGLLLGPLAARAWDRVSWAGVIAALAFVTTVAGAFLTALVLAVPTIERWDLESVAVVVQGVLAFTLIGLLFAGWLIGPLLVIPAIAWALVMNRLLPRR
jgi:hypothetical protein